MILPNCPVIITLNDAGNIGVLIAMSGFVGSVVLLALS